MRRTFSLHRSEKSLREQQSIRENDQEVINLDYFKVQKKKFNLRDMLQNGRVLDQDTDDVRFRSPKINTHLIHRVLQLQIQSNTSEVKKRKFETTELMLKNTNKTLINQIVFNKMRRRQLSQHDVDDKVFQGFKSLTSMFKNIHSLIDYHAIVNQIRQTQTIRISKGTEINLERQQVNFEEIVNAKVITLERDNQEILQMEEVVKSIRVQICEARAMRQQLQEEIQRISEKYRKEREYLKFKSDLSVIVTQLDKNEAIEINVLTAKEREVKNELESLLSSLNNNELLLKQTKAQKKELKNEISEFLKQVLASDDIQLQEPLTCILRILHLISESVNSVDLPSYLDEQSKAYLIQKSSLLLKLEEMKSHAKVIQSQTVHEDNRLLQQQQMQSVSKVLQELKRKRSVKEYTPMKTQSTVTQSFEFKLIEIDEQEMQRLQQLYMGRQLPNSTIYKLIKTIQACWGFKELHSRLNQILPKQK